MVLHPLFLGSLHKCLRKGLKPALLELSIWPDSVSSEAWAPMGASPEEGVYVHAHPKLPSLRGVQRSPKPFRGPLDPPD